MIHAEFKSDDNGLHMTIKGHAGQAPAGQDIVCSAVSILANMAARFAMTEEKCGSFKEQPLIKLEEGDTEVSVNPIEEKQGAFAFAYSFLELGFDSIAQAYPEYVELKTFGQTSQKV